MSCLLFIGIGEARSSQPHRTDRVSWLSQLGLAGNVNERGKPHVWCWGMRRGDCFCGNTGSWLPDLYNFLKRCHNPDFNVKDTDFHAFATIIVFFNKTLCGELKLVSEPASTHL